MNKGETMAGRTNRPQIHKASQSAMIERVTADEIGTTNGAIRDDIDLSPQSFGAIRSIRWALNDRSRKGAE